MICHRIVSVSLSTQFIHNINGQTVYEQLLFCNHVRATVCAIYFSVRRLSLSFFPCAFFIAVYYILISKKMSPKYVISMNISNEKKREKTTTYMKRLNDIDYIISFSKWYVCYCVLNGSLSSLSLRSFALFQHHYKRDGIIIPL